jgi:hypothetical protein
VPARLIEEFEVPDDVKGTYEEVDQESEDVVITFLEAGVRGSKSQKYWGLTCLIRYIAAKRM